MLLSRDAGYVHVGLARLHRRGGGPRKADRHGTRPGRRTRRQFLQGGLALAGLGLLSGCGRPPAQAPQSLRLAQVGWLLTDPEGAAAVAAEAFRRAFGDLGYVERQSVAYEYRTAHSNVDQLPALAAELVGLNVDVIVAVGTPAARAAKQATTTIPIVMVGVGDPVGAGLVGSLARPGGNLTGPSELATTLSAKRLELLKEALPALSRAAVVVNPDNPFSVLALSETQEAVQALGLRLQRLEVRQTEDLDRVFEAATLGHADALLVLPDNITNSNGGRIADLAAASRLPTMYSLPEYMGGGLMAYGVSRADTGRRAATYVDRILKGANPADLPVEQPTTFHFVINLRTVQALGLTIPPTVLQQATEVIE